MAKAIILKAGREKSVLQRHPWIFSGAIEATKGNPEPGETVEVLDGQGTCLGRAAYNPQSNIRARMWSFDPKEAVDAGLIRRRLEQALNMRALLVPPAETDALRLVHGESDGLPGMIVDRYADWLVLQSLTAGADAWRTVLVDELCRLTGLNQVYERSDVDVRKLEGLVERTGLLRGVKAPDRITIRENGLKFKVDLQHGQKTGFYLDQRRNRQRMGQLAAGKQVLNCFCYTGAFTAYGLAGGASEVYSVDSSGEALAAGKAILQDNQLPVEKASWVEGDVFVLMRKLRDMARSFDLIVLDPPKFAPTAAQAEQAARGYKDINLLAFKLLRPGGLLFTFSCSGGISADLFQKIVAGAALDAKVDAKIIEHLAQGPDHPVALNFPEGTYLKGLVVHKS